MKDVSVLKMINRKELSVWRQPLLNKGYSFKYVKGGVEGYKGIINIGIVCIEIDEFFQFHWIKIDNN